MSSGAGTNLKVGRGHMFGVKANRRKMFVVPFHFFGSKSTISRFCERFRDGQYSLFAVRLLTVLPSAPLPLIEFMRECQRTEKQGLSNTAILLVNNLVPHPLCSF